MLSEASVTESVTLTCGPAGGSHPDPVDACMKLAEVDGNFLLLEAEGVCSQVWAPVIVSATGHWEGVPVRYAEWHMNTGCAALGTDSVFAF